MQLAALGGPGEPWINTRDDIDYVSAGWSLRLGQFKQEDGGSGADCAYVGLNSYSCKLDHFVPVYWVMDC